jgi:hypothetical protein
MGLGISSVNLGQAFDPYSVRTTGDQTVSGNKTFNDGILFKKGDMPIGYLTGSFNEFLEANYLTLGVYPANGNEGYVRLHYMGEGLTIGEDGVRLINNNAGSTYIASNTNNSLFLQHPYIYINSTQTLFNSRPTVNDSGVLLSGEAYPSNNPSGYITEVDLSAYVTKSGGQFIDRPTVNGTGILLSGEAASLPTTIVYTTGDQTISGIKTFADDLIARSGIEIYFSGDQKIGNIISGNWNNTGIAYTGIRYDIRLGSGIVPSATNSLLNVSVNNTGVFNIDSRGYARITKNSSVIDYSYPLTVRRATTDVFTVRDDGATEAIGFSTPLQAGHSSMNADGFAVRSVGSFRISSDVAAFSPDVFLRRDGPGIFSQYNGINPQQYRIYNATGTNSGEFGVFGWQRTGASGTPNAFVIGAQATQSGTLRDVVITGTNINLASSGVTNFNNRPTVNGSGIALTGEVYTLNYFQITGAQNNLSGFSSANSFVCYSGSATGYAIIPNDTTFNFPTGTQINLMRMESGNFIVSGASGVRVRSADNRSGLRSTNSVATISKFLANDWLLFGDIA